MGILRDLLLIFSIDNVESIKKTCYNTIDKWLLFCMNCYDLGGTQP